MERQLTHNRRRLGPVTAGLVCIGLAAVGLKSHDITEWAKERSSAVQSTPETKKPAAPRTGQDKDKVTHAKPDDVRQAISSIKTGDRIRCPENPTYQMKVDAGDANSVICLDTKTMDLDAKNTLIVRLSMGRTFGKVINLGKTLDSAPSDYCQALTERMTGYTNYLIQQTGVIPPDMPVEIGLITGASEDSACHIYTEAIKDAKIVKPE